MAQIIRRKITDSILQEIRRRITCGEIREGDKLPNQNEFAAQLGVSRPSLREALHSLALLGVIEQRPGVGTVVRAQTPAFLAGDLDLPLISDAQGVQELIEARRVIEVDMVELAVERASDAELNKLQSVLQEMTILVETGRVEEYSKRDIRFHHYIAQAAHNRFLMHLFTAIRQFLDQFIRESFTLMPEALNISRQGHHAILEALLERNKRRAVAAMTKHIKLGQETLQKLHHKKVER
jgi:GntR family transcriptional regulator, transcriptional repressor for pyruvate dehydrogenase complex